MNQLISNLTKTLHVFTIQPNLVLGSGVRLSLDSFCHHQITYSRMNFRDNHILLLIGKFWIMKVPLIRRCIVNLPWQQPLRFAAVQFCKIVKCLVQFCKIVKCLVQFCKIVKCLVQLIANCTQRHSILYTYFLLLGVNCTTS